MLPTELAPWRAMLARALHRNRALPFARYFQLATVTPEGIPANRTVVFRGFAQLHNRLLMISDRRSAKFQDWQHQPWGAICWYFPKTREQFRLTGRVTGVTAATTDAIAQAERRALWQSLSESARTQFAWPAPGQPRAEAAAFLVTADPEGVAAAFALLSLEPVWVEHLVLRGEPQNRYRYHYEQDQWWVQEVNP